MPGARLAQVTARRPGDHPIKEPRLLKVGLATPQPALDLALEARASIRAWAQPRSSSSPTNAMSS
eukprot:11588283-Alexandrium_andersonii.AAC.1